MKRICILLTVAIICLCMLFACNDGVTEPIVSDTLSDQQSADNNSDINSLEPQESAVVDESVSVDESNSDEESSVDDESSVDEESSVDDEISVDEESDDVSSEVCAHNVVIDPAVASTCTETGLTEGSHCSLCGTVLKAQETVDLIPHNESEWIIGAEPTHTEVGMEYTNCTV